MIDIMTYIIENRFFISRFLHSGYHFFYISGCRIYRPHMAGLIIDFKSHNIGIFLIGVTCIRIFVTQELCDICFLCRYCPWVSMNLTFIKKVSKSPSIFILFRISVSKIGHPRN
ncbi:hypothetical protein D3C87_1248040 [compost metagenome]